MPDPKPAPLYGTPRPKNKPIPLSSSSIHALSTELSVARSALSRTEKSGPARARTKKSTSKTAALFSGHNKGVSERAKRDVSREEEEGGAGYVVVKTAAGEGGISERDLQRSRKSMLAKAKRYRQLRRGGKGGDALVDFDRKWGEEGSGSEEEEEEDGDDGGGGEVVEYEDEFGRTRTGTRGEAEREKRRREVAGKVGESVGEGVRPLPPQGIIYGNTIQTHAFHTPMFNAVPTSEELLAARAEKEKEDVLETHYDASTEVRTKGVGFFQFSKDVEARRGEMEELEAERRRTEMERQEKEGRRKRKREELEKRREEIKAKRRVKVGGSWLEDQFGDLLGGGEGAT